MLSSPSRYYMKISRNIYLGMLQQLHLHRRTLKMRINTWQANTHLAAGYQMKNILCAVLLAGVQCNFVHVLGGNSWSLKVVVAHRPINDLQNSVPDLGTSTRGGNSDSATCSRSQGKDSLFIV